MTNRIEEERQQIIAAREKGTLATAGTYARLSGPGWLQSAITLGGGSLASSLYLGVLGGPHLLWLQPLAMIMGVIMLSAIGYVALTTGERPFRAIYNHVNPVLAWGWIIATMMANLVWSLPHFSLATASIRLNLLPGLLGSGAAPDSVG
jgi:Mn2+/Fe2+ NRAMP family transporter